MFCSKCGTKNKEGAKFCVNCGEAMTAEAKTAENTTQAPQTSAPSVSNPGGIRKRMKADAKKRVNGSLVGATALYLIVCIIISMFLGEIFKPNLFQANNYGEYISDVIIGLIGVVFTFGLIAVGFNATRGKNFEFKDIFTRPFSDTKKLGFIIIVTLIIFAASFIIAVLSASANGAAALLGGLLSLAFVIAAVYLTPTIQAYICMLADDQNTEDLSLADGFKKALEITKGNRIEYYGVTISFIGWYLLSFVTLGILFIWLLPYVSLTMNNLYRKWIGEETFNTTETGLSNGAVIGISAAGCGCGFLLMIVVFASLIVAFITSIGVNSPELERFISQFDKSQPQIQDAYSGYHELNKIIEQYNKR